ncbi:MAG: helix-turn-helix transcriptional regulator [Firmicutes bacterium]|nr:helix-turn-helix transcriptional regulator [Bacillota bacterium]MBS6777577.1 helix-turn-helix transcriptional regulator [Butyricicoccus pullicaecorum]
MNERIKLLRKALELNQTDFGARIGVKQGTVAAYESGARVPLDSVIVSICREFGVSESWLRSGEGEMFLQLSREEEITKFCMSIIRDPDSEFQRQFVSVLARLEPPQWQLLSDMADKLLAQRDAQKKDAE